ncbi:MAG: M28 family peptidase [Gemmatimonadaceae bacterium]
MNTYIVSACILVACSAPATVARTTGPAPSVSVSRGTSGLDETIGLHRDDAIAAALGEIDPERIRHTDSMLVSFGTRNTFSDTMSQTRGIGAARRWLKSEFDRDSRECGGCLKVEYFGQMQTIKRGARDTVSRTVNIVDVLAWLPGRDTTHVIVMSGHYDSCVCSAGGSFDSTATAPGADDDGSGTSAVVELARVFSKKFPNGFRSTILFVTVAAEEQGLNGAQQLATRLHDQGYKVVAGMTDDIVGNVVAEDGTTDSTTMRIFGADPDNSPSRELARYTWGLDRLYLPNFQVLPVWRLDRIGRGGDHEPYVTLGDAGLRFTERLENYNRQHLPTDDFSHVNFGYVANVARVNAITVASLASAGSTPANARAVRQGRTPADAAGNVPSSGGQAWTMTWDPVDGALGYEMLIRRTTSANWEQVIPLGNVTRCTLKRQLDDEWAGVRAVGAHGERSMAASLPAPNPPRGTAPASRPARPAAPPQTGSPPLCGG